jgi:hypothetical protein
MENLIIFTNYSHTIPFVLGLFGKENLEYLSEFDENAFRESKYQIFYHKNLNSKIYFFNDEIDFLNQPDEFFNKFNIKLIFVDCFGKNIKFINDKLNTISNHKKCFTWHYGEVFTKNTLDLIKDNNYDFIMSASKRPELENDNNFYYEALSTFKYYRYYIGYYYLEDLIKNIELPKYNVNKSKIFSYTRIGKNSSWRNDIINSINGLSDMMESKNSANDAYDLLYPKYKHFEAIHDYLYCNFNIVFETIDYRNNSEYFITEKTYKALFFGKPILLAAAPNMLNYLKNKGFYLINFDFMPNIDNSNDVVKSIDNFTKWINSTSDIDIENRYNSMLETSIKNRKLLLDYLNDYSESEQIFKKLLNI